MDAYTAAIFIAFVAVFGLFSLAILYMVNSAVNKILKEAALMRVQRQREADFNSEREADYDREIRYGQLLGRREELIDPRISAFHHRLQALELAAGATPAASYDDDGS